jgi:hypothetical protein
MVETILVPLVEARRVLEGHAFRQIFNYIYFALVSNDCNRTVDMTLYILEHESMHCSTAYLERV